MKCSTQIKKIKKTGLQVALKRARAFKIFVIQLTKKSLALYLLALLHPKAREPPHTSEVIWFSAAANVQHTSKRFQVVLPCNGQSFWWSLIWANWQLTMTAWFMDVCMCKVLIIHWGLTCDYCLDMRNWSLEDVSFSLCSSLIVLEKYLRQLRYCPPPPLRDGMQIYPTDTDMFQWREGTSVEST